MPTNHRIKYKPVKVGDRFGRLVVLSFAGTRKGSGTTQLYWLCRCDCGDEGVKRDANLKNGTTQSCGCLQKDNAAIAGRETLTIHSEAINGKETAEYRAWRSAINRIENPDSDDYRRYAGRGINICAGWRNSYQSFLSDMGRKPDPLLSLDRVNNNGHYSCGHCDQCLAERWPFNCRWATRKQQAQNSRHRNQYTGVAL